MRSALDIPPDGFNAYEKTLVGKVREHGWFANHVGAGDATPAFSYTIGFALLGHPEIIVFSLPSGTAHGLFGDLYGRVAGGGAWPVGRRFGDLFRGADALLAPVDPALAARHMLSARWFYGRDDFPCLQLVWPDRKGRFPWEAGAEPEFAGDQPDLSPRGWAALGA